MKDQRKKRSWCHTSPREVHGDMLIRGNLPFMCRSLFSYYCVLWKGGEQNREGLRTKANNVYTVEVGSLNLLFFFPFFFPFFLIGDPLG